MAISRLKEHYRRVLGENSDVRTASTQTAQEFVRLIEDGTVKPETVSVREMLDVFALNNIRQRDPDFEPNFSNIDEVREEIMSSHFPWATGKLLHPVMIAPYELATGDVLQLFTQVNSRRMEEDIIGFGAGDRARHVEEGMPYPSNAFVEKRCRIRNHKLGKAIDLTVEAVLFDQTDQILQVARQRGTDLGATVEEFCCYRLMDTAWTVIDETTSQAMVVDGTRRAMYADTAAAWDTYANDNLVGSGSGGVPSNAQMKLIMQLFAQMKNDKNDPIRVTPRVVFANTMMAHDCDQYLRANNYDVNSAERDENMYKGRFRTFYSPMFPETASWFCGDPQQQFRVQWVWKPKITTDSKGDPKRDVLVEYIASVYLGIGSTDYRFVVRNYGS